MKTKNKSNQHRKERAHTEKTRAGNPFSRPNQRVNRQGDANTPPLRTDVSVTQILQQGHLSDSSARRSFFVFQSDLLQRHQVIRQTRFALVDGGVRSLYVSVSDRHKEKHSID